MKETSQCLIDELTTRYPVLEASKGSIVQAIEMVLDAYRNGKKILLCGNGGSASDCEHIAGELLKSFRKKRKLPSQLEDKLLSYGEEGKDIAENLEGALPVIALTSHIAFSTAFSNDVNPAMVFAQQLYALGSKGDVLIAISTSGNSKNCVYAGYVAKAMGIKTVSLTGQNESMLSEISDMTIAVPERETYKVQELHLPVYHCICAVIEEEMF